MDDSASDAATTPTSFHLFGALPLEIRRQIWIEALCLRCVIAPIFLAHQEEVHTTDVASGHPYFIGSAPYVVGQTCTEARALLIELHVREILIPRQPDDLVPVVCWARPDTTVICLGTSGFEADATLARLDDGSLFLWKHVMIVASFFDAVERAIRIISQSCPAIETVIIEWSPDDRPSPPSLERAAFAATCSQPMADELDIDGINTSKFRSLLHNHFDGRPPRIHFLPPYGA